MPTVTKEQSDDEKVERGAHHGACVWEAIVVSPRTSQLRPSKPHGERFSPILSHPERFHLTNPKHPSVQFRCAPRWHAMRWQFQHSGVDVWSDDKIEPLSHAVVWLIALPEVGGLHHRYVRERPGT